MWPWLLIGPYIELSHVSLCPSFLSLKGDTNPTWDPTCLNYSEQLNSMQKSWELLCKHNSAMVINSLSFNSTVYLIFAQNKHIDLQTSTKALRCDGQHFATSRFLNSCETEVVSTSKTATLKKNRTVLCHYCRVWAVGWWGSPCG